MLLYCYCWCRGNIPGQHPYESGIPCSQCNAGQICYNKLCGKLIVQYMYETIATNCFSTPLTEVPYSIIIDTKGSEIIEMDVDHMHITSRFVLHIKVRINCAIFRSIMPIYGDRQMQLL